ncbi:hypothetical protein Tco_0287158 [Tanacetum coccineum]
MTTTRSRMTLKEIKEPITQRVAKTLAEQEANRNLRPIVDGESKNGDDNGNGNRGGNKNSNGGGNENGNGGGNGNGNGGGNKNNGNNNKNGNHNGMNEGAGGVTPVARICTYKDILNCQPRNFSGTEGVVGLERCFKKMKLVFCISNCTEDSQESFSTYLLALMGATDMVDSQMLKTRFGTLMKVTECHGKSR